MVDLLLLAIKVAAFTAFGFWVLGFLIFWFFFPVNDDQSQAPAFVIWRGVKKLCKWIGGD